MRLSRKKSPKTTLKPVNYSPTNPQLTSFLLTLWRTYPSRPVVLFRVIEIRQIRVFQTKNPIKHVKPIISIWHWSLPFLNKKLMPCTKFQPRCQSCRNGKKSEAFFSWNYTKNHKIVILLLCKNSKAEIFSEPVKKHSMAEWKTQGVIHVKAGAKKQKDMEKMLL